MKYMLVARAVASFALLLPVIVQASPLPSVTLVGTIRDFNSYLTPTNSAGVTGHPDFENKVNNDVGIVKKFLGLDGKPVYDHTVSTATVMSPTSFYQWYHDDTTVNRTGSTTITLSQDSSGNYAYNNDAFFPIDGQLLAQNTLGHNFGFTTEFHSLFTYSSAKTDTFTFSGDDDVFVFVNKQLAIDLGGVHPSQTKPLALDNAFATTFGLLNGNNYALDIFQAERHTSGSNFGITTSLKLIDNSVPEPTSIALLGLGLLGFAASRRKSAK